MAKRKRATKKAKRRSYRVASPAIYRDSESAKHLRPEVRAALAGEAFELSDALRMPSSGVRAELSGGARFPTTAKYWQRYTPERLQSATPLKGESRARSRQRVKSARSFFARERERARRRTTKTQWRVALTGNVEMTGASGTTETFNGTQYGPWMTVPPGGLTDPMIQEAYREVARFTVSVGARGRPQFGELRSRGFNEYRTRGKSQNAILYIEHAEIESREVDATEEDEA